MKTRAGKRGAGSDLNHENWDAEEETEERGEFQAATPDVISKRVIKVAKRRIAGSEDSGTGGLFKSFTGFSSSTATTSSASGTTNSAFPAFNFGANNSGATKPFTFSASGSTEPSVGEEKKEKSPIKFGATPYGFKPLNTTFSFGAATTTNKPSSGAAEKSEPAKKEEEKPSTKDLHLHSLRDLNIAVNKWISSHVEKNPYCDLTPVFVDYEKHLKEIEKKYPYEEEEEEEQKVPSSINSCPDCEFGRRSYNHLKMAVDRSNGDGCTPVKPPTVPANFGLSPAQVAAAVEEEKEPKENEKQEEEKKDNPLPTINFQFGASKTESKKEKEESKETTEEKDNVPKPTLFTNMKFSFGPSGTPTFPFTGLSSWSGPSAATTEKPAEEEDYVPPKPEVREIKEDGSLITRRCKLYYKWEDAWVDKGVGNVHVKSLEEDKLQFLIRADTNLGTILLNVMVTAAIPISRNKTNLTLICVPTPPMTPKAKADEPMPLLVRFKTEADAEAVLEEINRVRKKE